MPFSPVPKFPEVIQDLKANRKITQTNYDSLRISIMRVIGIISDKTIKHTIRVMEDLGYIRKKKDLRYGFIWEICQEKPYNFPGSLEEEADKLLKGVSPPGQTPPSPKTKKTQVKKCGVGNVSKS